MTRMNYSAQKNSCTNHNCRIGENCFCEAIKVDLAESKLIGSWGRRSMAVAGEVARHGQAHPYLWLITIVSLRSKKSEERTTQK